MNPVPPNRAAKLWIFDFDNTLAALEREVDWPGSRRELEAFLRAEGVDGEIFVEIPKGNLPLYAALHTRWLRDRDGNSSRGVPSRDVAGALLRRASEIVERHELIGVERAAPTPGAIELLNAVAAQDGIVMIVTSNSSRTVTRWLQLYAVSDLVRVVIGRDSLLALKPSPEMVLLALELAGIPASDAIFVGDSEADLGAARAAGVGFYGIAPHNSARDRLIATGASEIFASPAALGTYLKLASLQSAAETESK